MLTDNVVVLRDDILDIGLGVCSTVNVSPLENNFEIGSASLVTGISFGG